MKTYTITHPQAQAAIIAANHRYQWGRWASARYAAKRGVPIRLYVIACQLAAISKGV